MPVAEDDDRYHLAALIHALGRGAARRAVAAAGSPRAALAALSAAPDAALLARRCAAAGIRLLTMDDHDYPALLRDIADAPPVLYARGSMAALLHPGVAVVGARRCTRLGAEVAEGLAGALAAHGACVISGLARGIDSAAHRAAAAAGVTAAVVGSGLARPYPAGSGPLVRRIIDGGGLLLSEYAPWQTARPYHFPERNRVISGLAMAVVVVEAGERSGSLITARLAAEQGREVCAVPGPVTSLVSRGCHRLIKQGAALVECADDVLEVLGLPPGPRAAGGSTGECGGAPADGQLARILNVVTGSVTTLDEIVAVTGVTGAAASAALVELELDGFVRQVPGGYIRRPLR